jgi:hypothetical protein
MYAHSQIMQRREQEPCAFICIKVRREPDKLNISCPNNGRVNMYNLAAAAPFKFIFIAKTLYIVHIMCARSRCGGLYLTTHKTSAFVRLFSDTAARRWMLLRPTIRASCSQRHKDVANLHMDQLLLKAYAVF